MSSNDESSGGPAVYTILSGQFTDNGSFLPPITCTVKFHLPGQIDPSSGLETDNAFTQAFVIDAFPQPFSITNEQVGNVVVMGDTGFVTSECDTDGDEFFDDGVGAYFPGLPLSEISLPASSIELVLGPI